MLEPDWDVVASHLIEFEEKNARQNTPPSHPVLVEWNGDVYIGSLQQIALEYSPEIVLLSKSMDPLPPQLKDALLRAQPKRTQVSVNSELDLQGRLHIVRKCGNGLEMMTAEQMRYVQGKPSAVIETNTGRVTTEGVANFYKDGRKFEPELN